MTKQQIPFIDLSRAYRALQKQIDRAIGRTIASGQYILGKEVLRFEKAFARYLKVSYAVGVASGTEAITLALWGLGVGRGDGVIVPANSLPSVWGVIQAGCRPVLVDVDEETLNLDVGLVNQSLDRSYRIKAILAVHLYGRPGPITEIMAIAKRYGLKVVEDCAQACGAKVGSLGDAAIFSFYPTKNLGGMGDGGMVVTNAKDVYEKVKILRMYGENPRYHSQIVGINSRLDELQAAILRVKLPHVDGWNKRRKKLAEMYLRSLKSLRSLKIPNSDDHVYHLYVIRTKRRDGLQRYLAKNSIGTMIHYPLPIHLQPALNYLGYKKGDFPVTEKITGEILSLPLYPELKDKEVERVCRVIRKFFLLK